MTTGSDNKHGRLSPSDSKRWTQCTAAIAFQEANAHRILRDDSSEYSREGTEAHEWAARVLTGKLHPEQVPEMFRDAVTAYVEHCKSLVPEGVSYQVEVQVPLWYQPDQKGTCDFAMVATHRVVIRDYKNGEGVLVLSYMNPQIAIYGYSLIRLLDDVYHFTPDTIIDFAVFQPRHREGASQEPWVLTLAELEEFCSEIEAQSVIARTGADMVRDALPCGERDFSPEEILQAAPELTFHPEEGDGGSCRWCRCKAFCGVRLAAASEGCDLPGLDATSLLSLLTDLTKDEKKLGSDERIEASLAKVGIVGPVPDSFLVAMLRNRKPLESLLSDIAEYLEIRALEGKPAHGTKLVMGRQGNRAWVDEAEADKFLTGQKLKAEERYEPRSLISPSTAEKLLKGKLEGRGLTRFNSLVGRSDAKKVITTTDDKREAVGAAVDLLVDLTKEEAFEI